jgi:hypothetical protein
VTAPCFAEPVRELLAGPARCRTRRARAGTRRLTGDPRVTPQLEEAISVRGGDDSEYAQDCSRYRRERAAPNIVICEGLHTVPAARLLPGASTVATLISWMVLLGGTTITTAAKTCIVR